MVDRQARYISAAKIEIKTAVISYWQSLCGGL
jgi:hypothetical protein